MKRLLWVVLLLGASLFVPAAARTGPSSGLIVFVSTRDGGEGIYAIRPDGTHLTRLATEASEPRVSPNGRHIAFTTRSYAYTVLDLASGARRRLPGGQALGLGWTYTRRPWSWDGSGLAVGADGGVHIYKADGTPLRVVGGLDAGEPTWSPDGKDIAYSGFTDGIYIARVDGRGSERHLVADGDRAEWSPDGSTIAFTRNENGLVTWVIPAAGGTARRIASGSPAWSPDGTTLAMPVPGCASTRATECCSGRSPVGRPQIPPGHPTEERCSRPSTAICGCSRATGRAPGS